MLSLLVHAANRFMIVVAIQALRVVQLDDRIQAMLLSGRESVAKSLK